MLKNSATLQNEGPNEIIATFSKQLKHLSSENQIFIFLHLLECKLALVIILFFPVE